MGSPPDLRRAAGTSRQRRARAVGVAGVLAAALAGTTAATPADATTLLFDFNRNTLGNQLPDSVFLFGDAGQTGTISSNSGFSDSFTLNADGFADVFLPTSLAQSGTGVRNTGLRIVSPDPIAGYFVNRNAFSTDSTFILDTDALGTDYVIASQGVGFGEGSQVAIQAVEDGTEITFTPKGGAPITQTLNQGETYKFAGGSTDLTGSTVSSTKPVAVSAGHECAQVPGGTTFCDTLVEQMIPVENLSSEYLVTASDGAELAASGADLVRVVATEDGTTVDVDGTNVATLNKGDVYEFELPAGSGAEVEASAPVLLAQYLTGGAGNDTDPAMALVPGQDNWLDSYRLATPTGTQEFDLNYASIVAETANLGSLMLDGMMVDTSMFSSIGTTGFSRGIVDLPLGLFDLTGSSDFLVMLGGGSEADSYFTYGGATFAPGVSPPPDPDPDPIPAPATLVLLGTGLALVTARVRRERRKANGAGERG